MNYAIGAGIVMMTASFAFSVALAQTNVVQQNSVTVGREGASVTISGKNITVETSNAAGRIVGDGQPASETRPIGPVSAVNADGAFVVTVKVGAAPGLKIEADQNLLPIVKTDVSNGRLDIYTDQSYSSDGRIKVAITSPDVTDISASGSNRIDGEGLTGGDLAISLNGSNSAELSGKVSSVTAQLSGSNHLSARELTATSANVTVNGSGSAAVNAQQKIVAEISGAGTILVYGDPKARSTRVNGAGKISFVE